MQVRIHHVAVQTANFDNAYHFFRNFLGLDVVVAPHQFKTRQLCFLRAANLEVELYSLKTTETATPYSATGLGPVHLAFAVDDLDTLLESCTHHHVRIIKQAFEVTSGDGSTSRLAFIEGPDGQEVELRQTANAL